MSEFYEIVIFTASLSEYARPLINRLDRSLKGFHQLYREHWTFHEGLYFVKDLSLLGRDLKDIIIIDNSPSAYLFQKENALPIISWYKNRGDSELFKLMPILEKLSTVKDVTKESLNSWKKRIMIDQNSPVIPKKNIFKDVPKTMKYSKSTRILFTKDANSNVSGFSEKLEL